MNTIKSKPTKMFWVIGVLAVLWNAIGVMQYLAQAYMPAEALAQMPEAQRTLFEATPAWVTGAFAVAVFAGFIGSVGLLIRKKWAKSVLILSLLAVLAQQLHAIFMTNALEVLGMSSIFLPITVLVLSIGLVLYANKALKRGWIG